MGKILLDIIGISSTQLESGAHALVLGQKDGKRVLPIVISSWEAYPIAMTLERVTPPRPMTVDLFAAMAHGFGLRLVETYIYKFQEGVFYAQLTFTDGTRTIKLDGRTSDAVAITLRTGSGKIYASEEVMDMASIDVEEENSDKKSEIQGKKKPEEKYSIEELEKELQQAIDAEDYNRAARLSDLIKEKKGDVAE